MIAPKLLKRPAPLVPHAKSPAELWELANPNAAIKQNGSQKHADCDNRGTDEARRYTTRQACPKVSSADRSNCHYASSRKVSNPFRDERAGRRAIHDASQHGLSGIQCMNVHGYEQTECRQRDDADTGAKVSAVGSHKATVLVALATTGARPTAIAAGNEMSVPPPATELMAPARHDARPRLIHLRICSLPMLLLR
jgi:hypothetical protein